MSKTHWTQLGIGIFALGAVIIGIVSGTTILFIPSWTGAVFDLPERTIDPIGFWLTMGWNLLIAVLIFCLSFSWLCDRRKRSAK